jgi:ribosomal-protein-alanine N-acetyltransferase
MHYRPMTVLDIPQVHAIDVLSFNLPWPEKSFQYELTQNQNSILWVAEALPPGAEGGGRTHRSTPTAEDAELQVVRIAGMIVVWLVVDEAHVATIAIHPDFRGLGISKTLLALGLKSAIERGAVESTLEVRQSNQVAQKLYEKFGYHEAGVRPRYYRDNNEDAILMTIQGIGSAYLSWLETVLKGT